jgi:hypothetical protein
MAAYKLASAQVHPQSALRLTMTEVYALGYSFSNEPTRCGGDEETAPLVLVSIQQKSLESLTFPLQNGGDSGKIQKLCI